MLGKRGGYYDDNYFSDESTPTTIMVYESRYSTGGKHSIKGLLKIIKEKNDKIRTLVL
jgi:hypothetical protein